jgi:hypothetical protein
VASWLTLLTGARPPCEVEETPRYRLPGSPLSRATRASHGCRGRGDRVGAVSPRPGLSATRRTTLAGALGGALLVAGCDADEPGSAPSPSAAATTPTPDDPDVALVDEVVAELDSLIALTEAAAAARPGIGRWPRALATLHRAHRDVLTDDETEAAPPPSRGSAAAVLRQVTARERTAQERLADWAVAAESGPLARLLASMSAAIAQQLATPANAAR